MLDSKRLPEMYDYGRIRAAEDSPFQVKFAPVPDRLAPLVSVILSTHEGNDGRRYSRVPEGVVHVVCMVTSWTSGGNGRSNVGSGVMTVFGPRVRRQLMALGCETLVAQLRPGAAKALLGVSAEHLEAEGLPANTVFGAAGDEALESIAVAGSTPARLAAFTRFLESRVTPESSDDLFAVRAAAWMHSRSERVSLREFTALSGYSDRQIRRKFRDCVGLSPKEYLRTLRLRLVLRMGSRRADWAEIAACAGYYDQAHLVDDFKAGLGLPPGAFFARPDLPALSSMGMLQDTQGTQDTQGGQDGLVGNA